MKEKIESLVSEINNTPWKTRDEITKACEYISNHSAYTVQYSQDNSEQVFDYPPQYWVQEIFRGLHIGGLNATKSQYGTITNGKEEFDIPSPSLTIDLAPCQGNHRHKEYSLVKLNENHICIDNIADAEDVYDKLKQECENNYEKVKAAFEKNDIIFINCTYGQSRSTTFAMYFLLKLLQENGHDINPIQLFNYIRSKRPIALPNPGFFFGLVEDFRARSTIDFEKAKPQLASFLAANTALRNILAEQLIKGQKDKLKEDDNCIFESIAPDETRNINEKIADTFSLLDAYQIPFSYHHHEDKTIELSYGNLCKLNYLIHLASPGLITAIQCATNSLSKRALVGGGKDKQTMLQTLLGQLQAFANKNEPMLVSPDKIEEAWRALVNFTDAVSTPRGGILNLWPAKYGETASAKAFFAQLHDQPALLALLKQECGITNPTEENLDDVMPTDADTARLG